MRVRKKLRQDYGYPSGENKSNNQKLSSSKSSNKAWNIPTVHSLPTGVKRFSPTSSTPPGQGVACSIEGGESDSDTDLISSNSDSTLNAMRSSFRACDTSYGNACFATGTLGLTLASVAVQAIATDSYTIPRKGLLYGRYNSKKNITDATTTGPSAIEGYSVGVAGVDETCSCGNISSSEPIMCIVTSTASTSSSGSSEASLLPSGQGTASIIPTTSTPTGTGASSTPTEVTGTNVQHGSHVASSSPATTLEYFKPSIIELMDAHNHLHFPSLTSSDSHLDEVLSNMHKVGIRKCVVCGTQPGEDWNCVLELSQRLPELVIPQFGLHPWRISQYLASISGGSGDSTNNPPTSGWSDELERLLILLPHSGVGECGLDKNIKKDTSMEVQTCIVREHFDLAQRYNRPVTLHCVGAWGTLYDTVNEYMNNKKDKSNHHSVYSTILHACNSMPIEFVPLFSKIHNVYFSLTMRDFTTSTSTKEVKLIQSIPIDRLLIETDSPDQLPHDLKPIFPCNEVLNLNSVYYTSVVYIMYSI